MSDGQYENWTTVFTTGTDYEADLVRDRLDDHGIPAVVLTQRDHAFNLNVGDLAAVRVMVPPDEAEEAINLIEGELISDEELEQAAMNADPDARDAHPPDEESALDSGNESLRNPGNQEAN
jgi:hypothetical protein